MIGPVNLALFYFFEKMALVNLQLLFGGEVDKVRENHGSGT
jgi:hypothetical protein